MDPDVKAIVATGYSNDPIISNFREHGFCGALTKPFALDQLRTALHDAIRFDGSKNALRSFK